MPGLVPPWFGLSAEVQFPLSVVCVAFDPCPLVVVQVPVSKVLPCAGFTAYAGAASAGTDNAVKTVAIANFVFKRISPHVTCPRRRDRYPAWSDC